MEDTRTSEAYVFWEGATRLHVGSTAQDVGCRILLPSADGEAKVSIDEQSISFGFQVIAAEEIFLEVPYTKELVRLFPLTSRVVSPGQSRFTFSLARYPIWIVRTKEFYSARALVVNLPRYWIEGRGYTDFRLCAGGWLAQLLPISEETLTIPDHMQGDLRRISYQLEFAREDQTSFTQDQLGVYLENLRLFLSFCRGDWVAISFTVAFDSRGNVAAEQWGTGKVSSYSEPSNWLDKLSGGAIEQLHTPFLDKLTNESWKDAINHVCYWFTRAETNNVGPDGGCVLLQVTLERLAWQLLVTERKALSKRGFEKLEAADQIRLMLSILGIPSDVPGGLSQLAAFGKSKGADGPSVFTYVRNRIVHPHKDIVQEKLPFYEAYVLGKWYVELAVLAACGYKGNYSNRTAAKRWAGQVEKVPWVTEAHDSQERSKLGPIVIPRSVL